jgi:mRNA interferase HigB
VRVIARKMLKEFCEIRKRHRDYKALKSAVDSWYAEARKADWKTPAEIKEKFKSASIISGDRVVFNIKGNDYRLVVAIDYAGGIVYTKWLGSHKDYDNIDARSVKHGN